MNKQEDRQHLLFALSIGYIRTDSETRLSYWVKNERIPQILNDAIRTKISTEQKCLRCRGSYDEATYKRPYCLSCYDLTIAEEKTWQKEVKKRCAVNSNVRQVSNQAALEDMKFGGSYKTVLFEHQAVHEKEEKKKDEEKKKRALERKKKADREAACAIKKPKIKKYFAK